MVSTAAEKSIWKEIGFSIAAHVGVVAIFIVKLAIFGPSEDLIVEQTLRVDLVGLPDKPHSKPEPVAPEPAPVPKPEKVSLEKPKTPDTKALKKAQDEALKRLEALAKIEQDLKNEQAKKAKEKQTFKGNQLSPGDSITGVSKLQHDEYVTSLDRHVKQHWVLPQWLENAKLRARALVLIDEKGKVIKRVITVSSNNQVYDQKVLEAIDNASPFPEPPEKFVRILSNKGVEFGFPD